MYQTSPCHIRLFSSSPAHPVPPCIFHIIPLCEFYSRLLCHKGTCVHLPPPLGVLDIPVHTDTRRASMAEVVPSREKQGHDECCWRSEACGSTENRLGMLLVTAVWTGRNHCWYDIVAVNIEGWRVWHEQWSSIWFQVWNNPPSISMISSPTVHDRQQSLFHKISGNSA